MGNSRGFRTCRALLAKMQWGVFPPNKSAQLLGEFQHRLSDSLHPAAPGVLRQTQMFHVAMAAATYRRIEDIASKGNHHSPTGNYRDEVQLGSYLSVHLTAA